MKTIPVKYIDTTKYIATITQDDCGSEDPLEWSTPEERGATFVLSHRRYNVPCEIDVDFSEYSSYNDMVNNHPKIKNAKIVKYVRWFEHSGIAVSLVDLESSCAGWDSGCAGIVFGDDENDVNSAFQDWKHYVEGDVWNVTIETEDGRFIDSCGGYFGREAVEEYIREQIGDAECELRYE